MFEADQEVRISIPADQAYVPVACLALSGLGMILGLDMELLGDLRTVTTECLDCLIHQAGRPHLVEMSACVRGGRLCVSFEACKREACQLEDPLSLEITRGVLETLMPQVSLNVDELGVHGIECSMPVQERRDA